MAQGCSGDPEFAFGVHSYYRRLCQLTAYSETDPLPRLLWKVRFGYRTVPPAILGEQVN